VLPTIKKQARNIWLTFFNQASLRKPMGKCEFCPTIKFPAVVRIISRTSVWNFVHVTLLVAKISR